MKQEISFKNDAKDKWLYKDIEENGKSSYVKQSMYDYNILQGKIQDDKRKELILRMCGLQEKNKQFTQEQPTINSKIHKEGNMDKFLEF